MGRVYSPIFEVPKGRDSCLAWPQERETNDGNELLSCLSQLFAVCFFPSHGATFVIRNSRHQFRVALATLFGTAGSIGFPRNKRDKSTKLNRFGQKPSTKVLPSDPSEVPPRNGSHHFLVALASFKSSSIEAAW